MIITSFYRSLYMRDLPTGLWGGDDYINTPALLNSASGRGSYYPFLGGSSWYDRTHENIPAVTNYYMTGAVSAVGKIDYTDNPNKKEFWIRHAVRLYNTEPIRESYGIAKFWNDNGVRKKLVASIHYNDKNSKDYYEFEVYNSDESKPAEAIYTCKVADQGVTSGQGGTLGIVDFRIFFSPDAGYIQVYNRNGGLLSEVLGRTSNGLKVTHIELYSDQTSDPNIHRYVLWGIAADEPTFGMFALPLYPSAEGSEQGQVAGTSSAGIYGLPKVMSVTPTTAAILAEPGVRRNYTVQLENPTTLGVPATYAVRSVKVSGAFGGLNVGLNKVPVDLMVKFKTGGDKYFYRVPGVTPDQTYAKVQGRHATLTLNPKTDAAWTLSDLTDLEVGFSLLYKYGDVIRSKAPLFFVDSDYATVDGNGVLTYTNTLFGRWNALGGVVNTFNSAGTADTPKTAAGIVKGCTRSTGLAVGGYQTFTPATAFNWTANGGYTFDAWMRNSADNPCMGIGVVINGALHQIKYDADTSSWQYCVDAAVVNTAALTVAEATAMSNHTTLYLSMRFVFTGGTSISRLLFAVNGETKIDTSNTVTVTGPVTLRWGAAFVDQISFNDESAPDSEITYRAGIGAV